MTTPQPFMGMPDLGGLLGGVIGEVTKLIPGPIGDAIQDTVGTILDPHDDSINEGDPQPPGEPPIPVEPGTEEMSAAVKALNAAIAALAALLKLGFMIPDDTEDIFRKIKGALETVRGWLD